MSQRYRRTRRGNYSGRETDHNELVRRVDPLRPLSEGVEIGLWGEGIIKPLGSSSLPEIGLPLTGGAKERPPSS